MSQAETTRVNRASTTRSDPSNTTAPAMSSGSRSASASPGPSSSRTASGTAHDKYRATTPLARESTSWSSTEHHASGSGSNQSPSETRVESPSSQSPSLPTPIIPQMQSPLLRSPTEIIQKVLATSAGEDPPVLAIAAQVCRELRSFIYDNPDQALWRDVHLQVYDDPRAAAAFPRSRKSCEFDWQKRVRDREFVGRMLREWGEDRYAEAAQHFDLICETLLDMYLDLPAAPADFDPGEQDPPRNSTLLTTYLRTPLFRHLNQHCSLTETKPLLRPLPNQPPNSARRPARTVINPAISRLHALLPPDFDDGEDDDRAWRGYMREVVYTAKNFQERNDWGPFTDDGKVEWPLVDAVSSVMMANGKEIIQGSDEHWRAAMEPMSFGIEPARGRGCLDLERPADLADDEVWDWANVKGTWCGSYAFMDYADWISLNDPRIVILRRSTHLDLSVYHEAVGDLMRLDLEVTSEPGKDNLPLVTTHLPSSDLLPAIHFHGSSVQQQGGVTFPSVTPMSAIRGVVRLTADDPPQVRWTLVIRYGGEDRWRLECVQVGGRGSKRGFFGIWTDALKEEHSPNGPVWYWKE